MSTKVNLKSYQDFVQAVTSDEANQLTPFITRLDEPIRNYGRKHSTIFK